MAPRDDDGARGERAGSPSTSMLRRITPMVAERVHLVRHGEVDNPNGLLYGRLPGFELSDCGHRMAKLAADDLHARNVPASRLVVSPLVRTRQSAQPIADAFGIEPVTDDRVIEPWNRFEGRRMHGRYSALRQPTNWRFLWNPLRPSWGEPYTHVRDRVRAAMVDAVEAAQGGDVIVVSHQLPIWVTHLAVVHKPLAHRPDQRRCTLSSITTLAYDPAVGFREIDYREPAAEEASDATDQGAV